MVNTAWCWARQPSTCKESIWWLIGEKRPLLCKSSFSEGTPRTSTCWDVCSHPVFLPYIFQVFFEPHSLVWFQYDHTCTLEPLPEAECCALFPVRHGVLRPAGLSSTLKSAGTKCKPYFLSCALSIAQGRQIKRSPGMDTYQFALSPLFCFLFWTSCQVFSNVP